jgi:MOSC domain-containing protein YiiM
MGLSRLLTGNRPAPTLTAIYVSLSAGEPMQSVSSVEAIAGKGLSGDRYAEQKGYYKSVDSCEVTMITQAEIDRACHRASVTINQQLARGGHRRNLVIAGIGMRQLHNARFSIGEVVLRYLKPRPPCAYIDRVSGAGMCKALGKHSGACIEVVRSGLLRVGEQVIVLE